MAVECNAAAQTATVTFDPAQISVHDRLSLRPEVGAISMSCSSVIVALNAVSLKRLRLPADPTAPGDA